MYWYLYDTINKMDNQKDFNVGVRCSFERLFAARSIDKV